MNEWWSWGVEFFFFNLQTVVYKLLDGVLSLSLALSLALFLQIRREVISVLLISSQSGKCGKLHLWSEHVWEMKAEGVKAFPTHTDTRTHTRTSSSCVRNCCLGGEFKQSSLSLPSPVKTHICFACFHSASTHTDYSSSLTKIGYLF